MARRNPERERGKVQRVELLNYDEEKIYQFQNVEKNTRSCLLRRLGRKRLTTKILAARNNSRRRGLRHEMIRNASQRSGSRRKLRNQRDVKLRRVGGLFKKYLEDTLGVEKRYNASMKMLQKMQKKMRKKFGNIADFVSDGGNDMSSIVGLSDTLLRNIRCDGSVRLSSGGFGCGHVSSFSTHDEDVQHLHHTV